MESDIPKMSIHIVQVFDNTSVLPDELIVQRLGIIPLLNTSIDQYLYNNECECESSECKSCSVYLTLNVVCVDDFMSVTSRHLISSDPNVYPVHNSGIPDELCDGTEAILITKLKKNQRLRFHCIAKKGIHKTHAKFGTTVGLAVRSVPNAKVDTKLYQLVESASQGSPQGSSQGSPQGTTFCCHELEFNPRNGELSYNGLPCQHQCHQSDSLKVIDLKTHTSLFLIESDGSLPPKNIMQRSMDILKNRIYRLLDEFQK
jgi:DNA-directed RNA polymerase alpha subunit